MASIDKIYATRTQYDEFMAWVKQLPNGKIKQTIREHIYVREDEEWNTHTELAISNFPEEIDEWLYSNCPLPWVIDRLYEQYDVETLEEWNEFWEVYDE